MMGVGEGTRSVVECLPVTHEALGSVLSDPHPTKEKTKNSDVGG